MCSNPLIAPHRNKIFTGKLNMQILSFSRKLGTEIPLHVLGSVELARRSNDSKLEYELDEADLY